MTTGAWGLYFISMAKSSNSCWHLSKKVTFLRLIWANFSIFFSLEPSCWPLSASLANLHKKTAYLALNRTSVRDTQMLPHKILWRTDRQKNSLSSYSLNEGNRDESLPWVSTGTMIRKQECEHLVNIIWMRSRRDRNIVCPGDIQMSATAPTPVSRIISHTHTHARKQA